MSPGPSSRSQVCEPLTYASTGSPNRSSRATTSAGEIRHTHVGVLVATEPDRSAGDGGCCASRVVFRHPSCERTGGIIERATVIPLDDDDHECFADQRMS